MLTIVVRGAKLDIKAESAALVSVKELLVCRYLRVVCMSSIAPATGCYARDEGSGAAWSE